MGIFDLNVKQYNSEYGCSVCVHLGVLLSNNVQIYLPHCYRERTHADVMLNAAEYESR